MASTLPLHTSLVKLLSPRRFLFPLLLLALSLQLHINGLLAHSLFTPPLVLSPLFLDKQAFLSHLLHFHRHYLGPFLCPLSIFILANLIILTLWIKGVYFSSPASDFSNSESESSQYGDASHGDFFLLRPYQHFLLAHDASEKYDALSFITGHEEPTCYINVQSFNKINNTWEKVKRVGIDPYIGQKEVKRPAQKMIGGAGKAQLALMAVVPTPGCNMLNVEKGKVEGQGLHTHRFQEETNTPTKDASQDSQAVVIGTHASPTNISIPVRCTHASPTNISIPVQCPSSLLQIKKQSSRSSANGGRYEVSRPILDDEEQALKPNYKPQKKSGNMLRSYSDQQLSQRDPSTEVNMVLTRPSSFNTPNKPHSQRARGLRSSSATPNTITNVTTSSTNKDPIRRAPGQSLHIPHAPNSSTHLRVTRSPSFSASLDELSDADANKCFSDFISYRFALMKKELD